MHDDVSGEDLFEGRLALWNAGAVAAEIRVVAAIGFLTGRKSRQQQIDLLREPLIARVGVHHRRGGEIVAAVVTGEPLTLPAAEARRACLETRDLLERSEQAIAVEARHVLEVPR